MGFIFSLLSLDGFSKEIVVIEDLLWVRGILGKETPTSTVMVWKVSGISRRAVTGRARDVDPDPGHGCPCRRDLWESGFPRTMPWRPDSTAGCRVLVDVVGIGWCSCMWQLRRQHLREL